MPTVCLLHCIAILVDRHPNPRTCSHASPTTLLLQQLADVRSTVDDIDQQISQTPADVRREVASAKSGFQDGVGDLKDKVRGRAPKVEARYLTDAILVTPVLKRPALAGPPPTHCLPYRGLHVRPVPARTRTSPLPHTLTACSHCH